MNMQLYSPLSISVSTTNIMVPVRGTLLVLGALPSLLPSSSSSSPVSLICNYHLNQNLGYGSCGTITTARRRKKTGQHYDVKVKAAASFSDAWKPDKAAASPSLSDVLWPSAGAFAAMALLGKMDQILAAKGLSMTIAPLGAVCAVLFTAPSSPAARKYNMFMSQIGCAAIGVVALTTLGPGWLARSIALAASIAFMIFTRSTHPPAASLPILFIDGAKLHHLNVWFAIFPGAAGCILLCIIQEMVCYLKDNFKF